MARSINQVTLLGHLGKDPELKNVGSGGNSHQMARTSLATSETWINGKNEKVEQTEWHNLVFWNKRAEIAEKYLSKGSKIHVTGKITTRSWETDQGEKKYITEIVVLDFIMLDGKPQGESTGSQNRLDQSSGSSTASKTMAEQSAGDQFLNQPATPQKGAAGEKSIGAEHEDDDLPF